MDSAGTGTKAKAGTRGQRRTKAHLVVVAGTSCGAAAAPTPIPSKPTLTETPQSLKETLTADDIDRKGVVEAILDDYAVQIAPFQVEDKRLEKKILAACASVAAEDLYAGEGVEHRLLVGAQAEQQQLVDGAALKILGWLGQELFLRGAGLTFKWLEAVLTPERYAEVVKKERTGRRSIKVVAKAAPEPLKAA